MEVLNLFLAILGVGFPGEYLHFRYLKCLVMDLEPIRSLDSAKYHFPLWKLIKRCSKHVQVSNTRHVGSEKDPGFPLVV